MCKLELIFIPILMFLSISLLFLVEVNTTVFSIIILLNIISGFLLYQAVKRAKVFNSIIKQGRDVLKGNLNRRIIVSNTGIYSELIIILNEITEKLQKEIIKSKETGEARKRLLSNISHDIRTPLTSILGYVEALRDDLALDRDEKEKYLDILVDKARSLKRLIDEIFQMARLDADDFELNFQIQDLAEIIRKCLIDFIPGIKKEDLETEIIIPEEDCLIYADHLSIERIIENILKNSLEYGKEGNFIGVELESSRKGFILSIQDRGPGIAEEDIPYVFERLYMGDKSRKNSLAGSGLGMAIAKKLLEKHGGSISLESIPGKKTVFKLFFPGI